MYGAADISFVAIHVPPSVAVHVRERQSAWADAGAVESGVPYDGSTSVAQFSLTLALSRRREREFTMPIVCVGVSRP